MGSGFAWRRCSTMTVAKRSIRLGVRLRPLPRPPLCGSGGQVADFGETAFACPLTRGLAKAPRRVRSAAPEPSRRSPKASEGWRGVWDDFRNWVIRAVMTGWAPP